MHLGMAECHIYYFPVTVTLTSDLVFRIIVYGAYLILFELGISVGRCVIPCAFFGKSVKHTFSCRKIYLV